MLFSLRLVDGCRWNVSSEVTITFAGVTSLENQADDQLASVLFQVFVDFLFPSADKFQFLLREPERNDGFGDSS